MLFYLDPTATFWNVEHADFESREKQKEWCRKQKARREQRKTIVNIESNVSALKWVKKDLAPEPVASEGAVPHATEACD